MRRTFVVLLFLLLCISMGSFVYANSPGEMIPGEETRIQLTYEEYIAKIAEINNIEIDEAIELDNAENLAFMKANGITESQVEPTVDYTYWGVSKRFVYSQRPIFTASCYATIKLAGFGSMYSIAGVNAVWSDGDRGEYVWWWNQTSAWYDNVTPSKCDLGSSGYFNLEKPVGSPNSGYEGFIYDYVTGSSPNYTGHYHSYPLQMVWTYRIH